LASELVKVAKNLSAGGKSIFDFVLIDKPALLREIGSEVKKKIKNSNFSVKTNGSVVIFGKYTGEIHYMDYNDVSYSIVYELVDGNIDDLISSGLNAVMKITIDGGKSVKRIFEVENNLSSEAEGILGCLKIDIFKS